MTVRGRVFRDSLHIISLSLPLVNTFFQVFKKFLSFFGRENFRSEFRSGIKAGIIHQASFCCARIILFQSIILFSHHR